MKVYCDYCGSQIDGTCEECPHCGAVNTHFVRTASTTPQTIEELKAYCSKNNLPLEKMHVHIGEDYKAPKAFGIYKDEHTGHFVVYKNKGDGSRAVRYEGTDEGYAVNELYTKIKDLVMDAREATVKVERRQRGVNYEPQKRKKGVSKSTIIAIVIIVAVLLFAGISNAISESKNGYYDHNGTQYYRHNDYWYYFDDAADAWLSTSNMSSYIDDDEYIGRSYNEDDGYTEFPTDRYSDDWDTSNDWDTDDDWSGSNDDSWDSSYDSYDFDSGSDWDSDW